MRSHTKASTAGSTMRQVKSLGHFFRGALATRGASSDVDGSGASSSTRLRLFLVVILALAAPIGLGVPIASAASPVTFGEQGADAGQLDAAGRIAVDQATGDIYISENNNIRVSKFDAAGNFLAAWGVGVANPSNPTYQTCGPEASPPTLHCFAGQGAQDRPQSVAVDQSTGNVYVREPRRVQKFTAAGEFLLMFGRNVNKTPGTPHPNLCTAADLEAGDICNRGENGTGPGQLESAGSAATATDAAGGVWVGGNNRLQRFNPDGTFDQQVALAGAGTVQSLALDSAGNFYVKSSNIAGIRKLEAGTATLIETLDAAGEARLVTVDGSDNVYVGDCGSTDPNCPSYHFKLYSPAGQQTYQFGNGQLVRAPSGIVFGDTANSLYTVGFSEGQIFAAPEPGPYVADQRVEDVLPTTATLSGRLNPENHATTYFFEYGTDQTYGQTTPVAALGASGFEDEDVEAAIDHLIPDTTYHFRLVATNHCNEAAPVEECTAHGEDTTFTTPSAALIHAEQVTDVTTATAALRAELDPLGAATTWWLEYGTGEGYGSTTPERSLGSGFGDVPVTVVLSGLSPATSYHYRFAARNERDGVIYTVHGEDHTFTTQFGGFGFELADDRAWELVSPPDEHGGLLKGSADAHVQAAADGSGIVYVSLGSIEANPQGSRAWELTNALARRSGASWRSEDLAAPNDEVTGLAFGLGPHYKLFSPNLSEGLLQPRSDTPLSPEASESTPYLRANGSPPAYTPLVTEANVEPGTEFGGRVQFEGASPDLDHIVLSSNAPLLAGAPAGGSLYFWSAGQLRPLSVLPAAEGEAMIVTRTLGSSAGSARHAVSDDGSRVFWSDGSATSTSNSIQALYLRDTEAEESFRIDVVQPGVVSAGSGKPTFQGANPEGTVAFFTDSRRLTEDASFGGRDLYRCEIPTGPPTGGCASLVAVSAPMPGSLESAEVEALVSGMSDDANTVYFVARGVLDSQPNETGATAVSGSPNLYLWRQGDGARFIATLAEDDENVWGGNHGRTWKLNAAASPNGRYLAFTSQRSLTGRDNLDANTGEPLQQVYRYDAVGEALSCVSCRSSGASPRGAIPEGFSPVDPNRQWSQTRVQAVLPEPMVDVVDTSLHSPRVALDNGRVFFNTIDSLVPYDSNGQWDVYQYEPIGVGDCRASSSGSSVVRSAGGCVSAISSGTGEEEAAFLDASTTGDDVFFLTPAQLNETDQDHELDVYDARVNGIPGTLPRITECLGESCQPAAQSPTDPTPASAAFRGRGNVVQLRSCRAIARRVGRLSHRARALRGDAKVARSDRAQKRMRRKAKRLARRAHDLGKQSKRCRRANRRAAR